MLSLCGAFLLSQVLAPCCGHQVYWPGPGPAALHRAASFVSSSFRRAVPASAERLAAARAKTEHWWAPKSKAKGERVSHEHAPQLPAAVVGVHNIPTCAEARLACGNARAAWSMAASRAQ